MGGILANTAWRALADVGSKLASIALVVVMARELGDAGFGVFTFAMGYVTIFTALSRFGQDAVLVREVARNRETLPSFYANTLALKLVLALPVAALGLATLALVGADRETVAVAAILMAAALIEAVVATPLAVYQAYERLKLVPAVLVTQRFATAAVGIAILLAGGGVIAVAVVYLAGTLVALALAIGLQLARVARPSFLVEPSRWRSLLGAAAPLGLAGIFAVVLFRVDAVILAAFESDEVVGDYGAAYRLFEATLFLAWAVGAAVYPVFSRLDDPEDLRSTLERSLALALAFATPFAAGAAVAGGAAMETAFGPDYRDGVTALRLLAPAILLFPAGYVTGLLLVARRRQRAVALTYLVLAVANLALNVALIPAFSLDAAALVTSLSELALALVLLVVAAEMLDGLDWGRIGLAPLVAGAAGAVAMVPFRDELVPAAVVGGTVYTLALVLVERIAFPRDARAVWSELRLRLGRA